MAADMRGRALEPPKISLKIPRESKYKKEKEYKYMSRDDLIKICEERDAEVSSLKSDIASLTTRLDKIETNLKTDLNSGLYRRFARIERGGYSQQQYGRREAIVGLPKDIKEQEKLEEKVVDVFKHAGVEVTKRDFHAIHRLKNQAVVIAKYLNRRDATAILRAKKKLREVDVAAKTKLGVKGKIVINESLCPEYRRLFSICNGLYKAKKLTSSYTINGSIKVVIEEQGETKIIGRINDLYDLFGEKAIEALISEHKSKMKNTK